jgi:DNA-binding response OmpR family regulator
MNQKIMVVDDDEAILDVVRIILENEGYEVETHTSGKYLYNLTDNLPALFILDVLLSGDDGRDICRFLRTNETTKHIPIILFSAHSQDDIVYTLPTSMYNYFIAKPFDINDLVKTVNNLVKL